MFVSALPDPTCISEKSANGGNKQLLLLLLILLLLLLLFLSQSYSRRRLYSCPRLRRCPCLSQQVS